MKVLLKLKNVKTTDLHDDVHECKICRNLCRIMNVKVDYVDVKNKSLSLIYETPTALALAMDELKRIGHPVKLIVKKSRGKLYRRINESGMPSQKFFPENRNIQNNFHYNL
ncbi:MAG: hypothetical protein CSA15_10295 [Candidatus Delongbacteria bacterium]|nr:MAG: hypothetical protein CSA15_10295 [Candidatus Delongbacteria bacterium]